MDLKKLEKEVDEIIAAAPIAVAALQVDDLSVKYQNLFSEKAKEALKKEIKELNPQMNEHLGCDKYKRVRCKTVFFSYCVRKEENMDAACERLISTINDLADRGFVHGFLAPLSKIRLYSETLDIPHAVFVFPHLTKEGAKYLGANKPGSYTKEGEVGPYIDSEVK